MRMRESATSARAHHFDPCAPMHGGRFWPLSGLMRQEDPRARPHRPREPRIRVGHRPSSARIASPPCRRSRHSGQERSSTFGAACPLPLYGSSSGSWTPENQGSIGGLRLREISVVLRNCDSRGAPTTGRPVSVSPPWCTCLRLGLSSGAFRLLTAPSAASTDGPPSWGQIHLGAGGFHAEPDAPVDGFPEQGRQVSSPILHRAICHAVNVTSPDWPSSVSRRLRSQGVPEAYSVGPAANIPTASFRLSVPTSLERPRWQSIAPPVAKIA